jgi:hypothetical protein
VDEDAPHHDIKVSQSEIAKSKKRMEAEIGALWNDREFGFHVFQR